MKKQITKCSPSCHILAGNRQGDAFVEGSSCGEKTREGTAFCIGGQILQGLNAKQTQHAEKNMLEANDVISQLTNREPKIISTVLSEMVVFNRTGGFGTLRAWWTVGTVMQQIKTDWEAMGFHFHDVRAWDKIGRHLCEESSSTCHFTRIRG